MATQRRRTRRITKEALNEKIAKAQDHVVTTKKAYEEALEELNDLLAKKRSAPKR